VSRSASEPVSASKRKDESGQPSEGGEARTSDEVTGMSSHSALRGGRGRRASRERSRNLGGPACWGSEPEAGLGIHNQLPLHVRESEGVVVCAWQHPCQEGSSPSGPRVRGSIPERGGNASRARELAPMENPKRARSRKRRILPRGWTYRRGSSAEVATWRAGCRVVRPNPKGMRRSSGP
jgi:hypothetical protein